MKKLFYISIAISLMACAKPGVSEKIKLNQLGYYPHANKIFMVTNSQATSFSILNEKGNEVYKGQLSAPDYWAASGENIQKGNFSALTTEGQYTIKLNNGLTSYPFVISNDIYKKITTDAMRSYYFQRMSIPIEEKYAGIYNRPMGHPDTACYFHPSTGYSEGKIASPGGWYDAGDYNKYIVNAGISVGFLLLTAEIYPEAFADLMLNIPESGNGKNDLLDEIKFELDWMLSMQDKDGGVFFKVTNLNFDGFDLPHKTTEKRYVVGKSTTSALCFAASLAQASRIYNSYDIAYSKTLLRAAEKAWNWAVKNPNVEYKNPADVHTGEYGDNNFTEEFYWAASQLFITTQNAQYQYYLEKYNQPFRFSQGDNWRTFVDELAKFSLVVCDKSAQSLKESIKNEIIQAADSILQVMQNNPYRIPMERFTWGSNSDIADGASIFAIAFKLSNDKKYLIAALETVDYIFGKNATGYSFVTGFGSKQVMNPHHRLSGADGIAEPIPGFLSGGPNGDKPDAGTGAGQVNYTFTEPARSFMDVTESYASNEIAINWNAPLVFILSFINNELAEK